MRHLWYDPDGQPITMEEWTSARSGDAWKNEHLVTEISPDIHVSTVWLGLDHSYDDGPPIIFETLIFGGPLDQEMWRYATRAEARAGHENAVELARVAGEGPPAS